MRDHYFWTAINTYAKMLLFFGILGLTVPHRYVLLRRSVEVTTILLIGILAFLFIVTA